MTAKPQYNPKRIKARKHMGDDKGSWAVFLDGRPVVTGLTRSEVPYWKNRVWMDYIERCSTA